MYQVLARKCRPQTFEELIGQPHVSRTLANAIRTDRLAHAYIFAGVRGTGKTSAARIFAKCLNCEKGPTPVPCNSCDPCREIADGQAMDVMEIDAASRTKVEQTRELLEVVSYAPVRDRYKVLIIDEVHMLSNASFNALLKTLEEPPRNVMFVLATTEIQKVLATILSRCQVFEFRRVTPKETTAHLRKLCDQEGIKISDISLDRIARAGEGSVRDSLSVLERVMAFCAGEINDEDVLRVLGAVRAEVLSEMIGALARRDAAGMITVLDGLVDEGHDLVHFWSEIIGVLRDLLLQRTLPDRSELLLRPVEEANALAASAADLSVEDLSRVFQVLADMESALKFSAQPRFMFEATLIRLASLGAVRPIEEFLAALGDAAPPAAAPKPGPRPAGKAPRRSSGPKTKLANAPEPQGQAEAPREKVAAPAAADAAPGPAPAAAPAPGAADPGGGFAVGFRAAVDGVKPMLGALIEQASSIRREGDTAVIAFPEGREALRRQLEHRDSRSVLVRCAGDVTGTEMKVRFATAGADAPAPTAPEKTRAPAPGAADSAAAPKKTRKQPEQARLIEQAKNEPGVKKLLREFGAQVVDARPNDTKEIP